MRPAPCHMQVVTFFSLCTILGFGHGIIGGFLFMHLAELGQPHWGVAPHPSMAAVAGVLASTLYRRLGVQGQRC